MLIGNKFDSLKKVHVTFDPTGLYVDQPYIIQKKDAIYFGVLSEVDAKHMIFNYFNGSGRHQLCVTTNDEFDLYELKSSSHPEEIEAWNLLIAMDNLDFAAIQNGIDIACDETCYRICNTVIDCHGPLFIKNNDNDYVINYEMLKTQLKMKDIMVRVEFSTLTSPHGTSSYAVFCPEDIELNNPQLLQCIHKDRVTGWVRSSISINSNDWRRFKRIVIEIVDAERYNK